MFAHVKKEPSRVFEVPMIIDPALDYLEKAQLYFEKKDYPTCANYQRKWYEQYIKKYLQENYRLELTENDGAVSITGLNTLFGKLTKFYEDCEIALPKIIEEEFHLHRDTVMNPFSHDDLRSPVYRQELERGFRLIESLEALKPLRKSVIAHRGDIIEYVEPSLNYSCRFKISTELLSLVKYGSDAFVRGKGDVVNFNENGTTKPVPKKGMSGLTIEVFCEKIAKHLTDQNTGFTPNSDRFAALVLKPQEITFRQIIDG